MTHPNRLNRSSSRLTEPTTFWGILPEEMFMTILTITRWPLFGLMKFLTTSSSPDWANSPRRMTSSSPSSRRSGVSVSIKWWMRRTTLDSFLTMERPGRSQPSTTTITVLRPKRSSGERKESMMARSKRSRQRNICCLMAKLSWSRPSKVTAGLKLRNITSERVRKSLKPLWIEWSL